MYCARDAASGTVLADRLRSAHTHWTRLKGLLGTRRLEPGEGLWLKPCNQVHMIGMRYAIDVAFLDDDLRVVRIVSALAPGRFSPRVKGATSALELPAGRLAAVGVSEGGRIEIAGDAGPPSWVDAAGAAASNLLLASLFALFAYAHFTVARATGRWATTLPLILQEALLVVLILTRRRSIASSSRLFDWLIGGVGTFLPLLLRPGGPVGPLNWLGQALQVIGLGLSIAAIVSLGRSFAVVAGNRGIKTAGVYRFVRHPIYAAYIVSYLGYVASFPTLWNCLITAVTVAALYARAIVEERFLAQDAAYRDYLHRVRARFVPYLY
jgi:protein-S-isoprenylcysteine O-methyltransferase Ste14/uncharacterized membrane protein (UPF0127 family)